MARYHAVAISTLCISVLFPNHSSARDNGQFTNSPLKQWFDKLASGKGLCCSFADGVSVKDVDWDAQEGTTVCVFTANGLMCLTTPL